MSPPQHPAPIEPSPVVPGDVLDPGTFARACDYLGRRPGDGPDPDQELAWARVHALLEPLVRRVARRGGLDPDDAAQEAWLALLRRLSRFRAGPEGPGGLQAWAAVVARRRLARLARAEVRRALPRLDPDGGPGPVDPSAGPDEACERADARAAVRSAINVARRRLPEASYRVLALRWLHGRSVAQIAEDLGLTTAQVRDRHRRALPLLRRILAPKTTKLARSTP